MITLHLVSVSSRVAVLQLTSVNAEDVIVDNHAQRQVVEHVGKVMPYVCVAILATALSIESVALCDAPRFVVAPDQMHTRRVSKLEAHEQRYCLDREQAAVYIIAQKQVIGVRAKPANLEDLQHVEELAVDVAHHRDGRENVHYIGLVHELFLELVAYRLDDRFCEELLLVEPLDALVEVDRSCACAVSVCYAAKLGSDAPGSPGILEANH